MSIVDKLLEAEGDIVLGFRRPDLSDLLREAASEIETLAAVNADLLEALEELCGIVEWAIENKSTEDMDSFTLQPAQAAIAKAKRDDHA